MAGACKRRATLSKDLGRAAGDAYAELTRTARALRRDAQRTNRRMLKDFDQLRAAVTPSASSDRATRRASRSSATGTATGSSRSTSSRRAGSTANGPPASFGGRSRAVPHWQRRLRRAWSDRHADTGGSETPLHRRP